MFVKLVQAVEKLNAFSTVDDLVNEFDRVGLVGYMRASGNCPVARYLRLPLNIPASDLVVGNEYVYYRSGEMAAAWNRAVALSPTVLEFIDMFDEGKFPYLISEAQLDG